MITHTPSNIHWNYFCAIEQDVENVTRFIEPVKKNNSTFSIELCRILFASCAECEVVLKQLISLTGPKADGFNMPKIRSEIAKWHPEILTEKVWIRRYGVILDPWSNWREDRGADWWDAYNLVKHHRGEHFAEGNLKNMLNSVAALLISIVYYYRFQMRTDDEPVRFDNVFRKLSPESRLFFMDNKHYPKGIDFRL